MPVLTKIPPDPPVPRYNLELTEYEVGLIARALSKLKRDQFINDEFDTLNILQMVLARR